MEISTFKDMYLAELQELVSAEAQLDASLLRLAETAAHSALKDAFAKQRQESEAGKEILHKGLEEEKLADSLLNHLAKYEINPEALSTR